METKEKRFFKLFATPFLVFIMLEVSYYHFVSSMYLDGFLSLLPNYIDIETFRKTKKLIRHISPVVFGILTFAVSSKFYLLYFLLLFYNIGALFLLLSFALNSHKIYVQANYLIVGFNGAMLICFFLVIDKRIVGLYEVKKFITLYFFFKSLVKVLTFLYKLFFLQQLRASGSYTIFSLALLLSLFLIYNLELSFSNFDLYNKKEELEDRTKKTETKGSILKIFQLMIVMIMISIGYKSLTKDVDKFIEKIDIVWFMVPENFKTAIGAIFLIIFDFLIYQMRKRPTLILRFGLSLNIIMTPATFFLKFEKTEGKKLAWAKLGIISFLARGSESIFGIQSFYLIYKHSPKNYRCLFLSFFLGYRPIGDFFQELTFKAGEFAPLIELIITSIGSILFIYFGFEQ